MKRDCWKIVSYICMGVFALFLISLGILRYQFYTINQVRIFPEKWTVYVPVSDQEEGTSEISLRFTYYTNWNDNRYIQKVVFLDDENIETYVYGDGFSTSV